MTSSTMTIEVDGMTCEGCARAVRAALLAIDGVTDARANPQTGVTELSASGMIEREQLARALDEAGFRLR